MRWRDIPFHPPLQTLRWFTVYTFVLFSALAVWRQRLGDRGAGLCT